ncbi:MAG: glutamate-1-semialdehyde 2,1-aminomutase [Actinobacteria bacterium]|nr:glutamate-1-semialdehyde 2,1-aminomutase [Actinomycetota bacterium]
MTKSGKLYRRALLKMPGGVNSPVRAFKSVNSEPVFIKKAEGAKIFDEDGKKYIDFVCSWGAIILGHSHPVVVKAAGRQIRMGSSYGAPTKAEVEIAEIISEAIPSIEMLRLTSSGTEAVMSAIRLARAFTGKKLVVKFAGCYHGHSDGLLSKTGSGLATHGIPSSPGVPEEIARLTITVEYNDISEVKALFEKKGGEIACIILEPVAGNMGVVTASEVFLSELRRICNKYGSLLIFDEIITGFRIRYGGVQDLFGIRPDLTILGKIIGGGYPLAGFGGRREIMKMLAPEGEVYQAGTLSGNPVAASAGIACLKFLKENKNLYAKYSQLASELFKGIKKIFNQNGIPVFCKQIGLMGSVFFLNCDVINYTTAKTQDTDMFKIFFKSLFLNGIYLPPSLFEAWFLTFSHSRQDVEETLEAVDYFTGKEYFG